MFREGGDVKKTKEPEQSTMAYLLSWMGWGSSQSESSVAATTTAREDSRKDTQSTVQSIPRSTDRANIKPTEEDLAGGLVPIMQGWKDTSQFQSRGSAFTRTKKYEAKADELSSEDEAAIFQTLGANNR